MRNRVCKVTKSVFWLGLILFLLGACAFKSGLLGKWKEIGKTATLEFSADGTFKAVDNQGMAVSGRYTLLKDGSLRCEVQQGGHSTDVVNLTVSFEGDELTLTSPGSNEIERYRKEK